jgi:hypothetical protein
MGWQVLSATDPSDRRPPVRWQQWLRVTTVRGAHPTTAVLSYRHLCQWAGTGGTLLPPERPENRRIYPERHHDRHAIEGAKRKAFSSDTGAGRSCRVLATCSCGTSVGVGRCRGVSARRQSRRGSPSAYRRLGLLQDVGRPIEGRIRGKTPIWLCPLRGRES